MEAGDTPRRRLAMCLLRSDAPKNPKATVTGFGKCPKLVRQAAAIKTVRGFRENRWGGSRGSPQWEEGDFRNAHAKHFDSVEKSFMAAPDRPCSAARGAF